MNDDELGVTTEERWRSVGTRLRLARMAQRLSKREAARRAGFADVTWRQLENGRRNLAGGLVVPVNPNDSTLEAAATAVGVDPAELFEAAGRPYTLPPRPRPTADPLEGRVDRLEGQMESVLEELRWVVDRLQGDPESAP